MPNISDTPRSAQQPYSFLIVDDQDAIRNAVHQWLTFMFPRCIVIEAQTGEEAVDCASRYMPTVILMDIDLPTMSGIEATRRIKHVSPQSQVIMLTIHDDQIYRTDSFAAGASAYVPKHAIDTSLAQTIRATLNMPALGTPLSVLNALSAHAVVLDATGTIVAVNAPWDDFARANGAPDLSTTSVGVNYLAVCRAAAQAHDTDAAAVADGIEAVLAGAQDQFTWDYPCHAPHEQRWFQLRVTPLDAERLHVVVIHENITAGMQNEAVRAQMAAIVDASDDAIAIKSLDGIILSWNVGAERMYGYSAGQIVHQPMTLIVPADHLAEEAQVMARIGRGERIAHYESVRVHQDGRRIDVSLSIAPLYNADGSLLGASSIARDITERKRAERALQRQISFNRMLQDIAVAANEAASLEAALQIAVDQICSSIGWPLGHVYLRSPDDPTRLSSTTIWHVHDPAAFAMFRSLTEALLNAPAHSLPAQVLASGKPIWTADVRVYPTSITQLIQDLGVRASLAFPVLLGDEIVAVLEFYDPAPIAPDAALLAVLASVGTQLGRVVERARAEQALHASIARYQLLFDHNPLPLWVYDLETLAFLAVNNAAVHHYGYARETFLTMTITDLCPQEDLPAWLASLVSPADDSIHRATSVQHTKQDTTIIDVEIESQAISFSGRAARLVLAKDVTKSKRTEAALRESMTRLRLIWESAHDAMVLSDVAGVVLDANPAYSQLYGYTPEQIIGQPFTIILPADRRAEALEVYRAYFDAAATSIQIETMIQRADGAERWVESFACFILQDGRRTALLSVIRDVTERKHLEDALFEERALLVRRIDERTADLSAINAQLARALRLKDEFLSSMSHELRTPLNAVLGLSEALQEDVYGALNHQQRHAIQTIAESGQHLLALINDILDLAKINADKLELDIEPTPVAMVCQASLRLVAQAAHVKRITIEQAIGQAPENVRADSRRLKQILVNLLSNAVKFTPDGGRIGLSVESDAEHQRLNFTVWDNGIGIAPDHIARLFQPFVQLDSRLSRQYAGTGLGLGLVARMVDLHGGSITVSSTVNVGSRFTVALPWQPSEHTEPDGDAPEPRAATAHREPIRRALLVDDSPTTIGQVERYLGELGVAVESLSTGGPALERAAAFQPDLILLDILLPDISGWEVLSQLKADPRTQAIPVAIMSVVDTHAHGQGLGAAASIVKPCTRHNLRQLLDQFATIETADLPAPAQPSHSAAPVVLLAEDNEVNITMIADYLSVIGYRVSIARNGREAIARAHDVRPALILMDIQMPGMDGLEAIRHIRADDETHAIPIVALTALAMPGDREMCIAAGANTYLSKPISLKRLAATIAIYLQPIGPGDRP